MTFGSLYTVCRYVIIAKEITPLIMIGFVSPLPFMFVTCRLVYEHSQNEFLRYDYQKELVQKFRKILKEFPEQILITQQSQNKLSIPFTNDERLLNLLKPDSLLENEKVV